MYVPCTSNRPPNHIDNHLGLTWVAMWPEPPRGMAGKPRGDQSGQGYAGAMGYRSGGLSSAESCGHDISAVEEDILYGYWCDYRFALQHKLDVEQLQPQHFFVSLSGRHVVSGDSVLVTGALLDSWVEAAEGQQQAPGSKVVVRLSLQNWYMIAKHVQCIRILNAQLIPEQTGPVIDTTIGSSVVSGNVVARADESIQVSEIFSGGFLGWSQAISILEHHQIPVQVRWMLDREPLSARGAAAQFDSMCNISAVEDLQAAFQSKGPFFVNADAFNDWWLQIIPHAATDLWCASPPCQPWSAAGSGQGLHCKEGQLMLRLAALLEAFQPKICCLEQVEGFCKHRHFRVVQDAWNTAGYEKVWSRTMDLVDCAPETRRRYLLVLARKDVAAGCQPHRDMPVLPRRPTLGSFQCILQLPSALKQACQLAPATLAMYLDPYFLPPCRNPERPLSPIAYRVKDAGSRLNTIMAQYHFQHELPQASLERGGILGCLFRDQEGLRFMAGAEIALVHCNFEPLFLPSDDRELMRVVGNSLAIPQAMCAAAYAVSCLQPVGSKVDPCQAVLWSIGDRQRAHQISFVALRDGWVMCTETQIPVAMARLRPACPWGQIPLPGEPEFHFVLLHDSSDHFPLVIGQGMSLHLVLESLGFGYELEDLSDVTPRAVLGPHCLSSSRVQHQASVVELPTLPWLTSAGLSRVSDNSDLVFVLGSQALYAVARNSPTFAHHMNRLAWLDGVNASIGDQAVWMSMRGVQLSGFQELKHTVLLLHHRTADPVILPDTDVAMLPSVLVMAHVDPPKVFLPEDVALQMCSGLPMQFFCALGWFPQLAPARYNEMPGMSVLFQPRPNQLRLAQEEVMPRYADALFQGSLTSWQHRAMLRSQKVKVKVQVMGHALWKGFLPGDLTFANVLQAWQTAQAALGFSRGARIGSGPLKPCPSTLLLQASRDHRASGFVNRKGELLVTVLPETRGGGAKDVKYHEAQSRLATELLEHGVSLADSALLVDRLLQQAGQARVVKVNGISNPDNRWQQLLQLFQQFRIELPPVQPRQAKAEQKVRSMAQSRAQQAQQQVKAADVKLQDGYFYNVDGTAAAILHAPFPGCSGVCLQDFAEAAHSIEAFHSLDELAIVVIGHRCPHTKSCTGRVTVPALNAAAEPVLLAACMHQLG